MKSAETPLNEDARLRALRDYSILDTHPERAFDALTTVVAHLLRVPIALVSLVDADRQWFKSRYGLDAPETPRNVSFCGHVVFTEEPLVVRDAWADERFADNPLVTGAPRVRFYAGAPLRTQDGLVLGTLCAIDNEPRDITADELHMLELLAGQVMDQLELRRQNRALLAGQAATETLGHFFEVSLNLLCTADSTLHFRDLNPAWETTLGWTRDELRARPFTDFVHPDDLETTFEEAGKLANADTKTVNFENRYRHKDGHFVPLLWTAASRDGVFFAAAHDISEYKRHVNQIASSASRLRAIFETAVDPIITIDAQGRIETANPAVSTLLGYSPDEVVGKNVSILMPSPDRERHDGYLARFQQTGERRVIGIGREVTARRKDGTLVPVELAVSEMTVDDRPMFTGILRDLTERKQVERLQADFISTVSHELRTPLTSIRGSLGLMAGGKAGSLPDKASRLASIALDNTDRLVRLINDILDIDKMASGRMEFRLQPLDLTALLEQATASMESFVASNSTRVVFNPGARAVEVIADPDRLLQVVVNLISNAAKFSPPGQPIELAVWDGPDRVRVEIRDHGPGIPPEFRSRVFQRFAQADSSDARRSGGTGLGLAISRVIIERLNGRIGFEDVPTGGTCFFFELPRVAASRTATGRGTARVLVCEDDPDTARILQEILEEAGVSSDVAPNAARARDLISRFRYEAVTLDLTLTDGDSSALVGELRRSAAHRSTPIIVVTGSGDSVGRLGPFAASVTDILTKPVDPKRLLTALRAAVGPRVSPRVLHIEDDNDLRQIVRLHLPVTWDVYEAGTLKAARAALEARDYDVVLLDLALPDGNGEDVLDHVGGAQVIVFSAREVDPAHESKVRHSMTKSRAGVEDLREALIAAIEQPARPAQSESIKENAE